MSQNLFPISPKDAENSLSLSETPRDAVSSAQKSESPSANTPVVAESAKRAPWFLMSRRALPFWVALLSFVLFASNVSSTVTYGSDCGEFAAAASRLGIGHPTGFVFYCLVARVWISLLALGEVAWRLNIFSALCGALALGLTCAILNRVLDNRVLDAKGNDAQNDGSKNGNFAVWASAGACFLLAGFLFFFCQAVIINVHILIAAMTALLIFCAVRWHHSVQNGDADWRWLGSMAVLAGLALNTHMSWVFAFPGLFYLTVWHHRAVFGGRRAFWKRLAGLFALTLAAYAITLYLPLRSSLFPAPIEGRWWALDWTHPANFVNWYRHVRAHQYEFLFLQPTSFEFAGRHFAVKWFASSPTAIPGKLWDFSVLVFAQLLWAFPLVFWGARVALQRDRALGIALLLIVVVNLGFEINYDVPAGEMANFLFPSYLAMTIWLGLGLHSWLLAMRNLGARWDKAQSSTRLAGQMKPGKMAPTGWSWRLATLAKLLIPATVLAQWSLVVPARSARGDTSARQAALERATSLENLQRQFPGKTVTAVMTYSDDTTWSFWYAQFVLGRARGVQTPWGVPPRRKGTRPGVVDLIDGWQARGPVAFAHFAPEIDARFPYVPLSPNGLIWLASRRALPLPATPISNFEYSIPKTNSSANRNSTKNTFGKNALANRASANDASAKNALPNSVSANDVSAKNALSNDGSQSESALIEYSNSQSAATRKLFAAQNTATQKSAASKVSAPNPSSSRDEPILGVAFPAATMRPSDEVPSRNSVALPKMAHLKRENMTLLTLDFRAPFATALSPQETGAPTTELAIPAAQQIGYVEILVSPQGFFAAPPPSGQSAVVEADWRAPAAPATYWRKAPLTVTWQSLRLAVPPKTKIGAPLRAQLPLQIGVAGLGKYEIWLRLVRHKADKTTQWKRVATVLVTGA